MRPTAGSSASVTPGSTARSGVWLPALRSSQWRPPRTAGATGSSRPGGRVFHYGDAHFYGSATAELLSDHIVSMAASRTAGAIGSSRPTAGSSTMETPTSTARSGVWLSAPDRRHGGHPGWPGLLAASRPTAGSSTMETPTSTARPRLRSGRTRSSRQRRLLTAGATGCCRRSLRPPWDFRPRAKASLPATSPRSATQ